MIKHLGKVIPNQIALGSTYRIPPLRHAWSLPLANEFKEFMGWQRLATGEIKHLENDYSLERVIASGRFGTVHEACKITAPNIGTKVAVKRIPKSRLKDEYKTQYHDLVNEIKILQQLDHPNVMKLRDVYEDNYNLSIVSDLYTGSELFEHIIQNGSLTEAQSGIYIKQILEAVDYCHSRRVVHRDIKPENLIFRDDSPDAPLVLIDFGMSKLVREPDEPMRANCGSPSYVAPEVLLRSYDSKCDLWSVGVLMYVLLSGTSPFEGDNEAEIMAKVLEGRVSLASPAWGVVSDEGKGLLKRLLARNPADRPSAAEAMQHSWVQSHGSNTKGLELETALENMKRFVGQRKVQQMALRVLTNHVLKDHKEVERIRSLFESLDMDKDGYLTPMELLEVFRCAEIEMSDEVRNIVDGVDLDGNGKVEVEEFVASAVARALVLKEVHLRAAFAFIDKDGNGRLSREELESIMEDSEIVDEILRDTDANDDGEIDLEEFLNAFRVKH